MGFEIGRMLAPVEDMRADRLDGWRKETGEGNYRLVDVRQPAEYERGHIPGAVLIPLAGLPSRAAGLAVEVPVVVYCAVGGRSRAAARYLAGRGFSRVINLEGGIKAYRGAILAGPPDVGLDLLRAVSGAGGVLETALAMETVLRGVYASLALEAAGETAALLVRLAGMEDGHVALIEARMREEGIGAGPDIAAGTAGEGGGSAEAIVAGLRPLLGDPAAVIDAAMGIELAAFDLYVRMAEEGPAGTAPLFFRLAEEERGHMEIVARLPGGPSAR